jgi:precorrin-6A/cobalt-precorrin-6A reductase
MKRLLILGGTGDAAKLASQAMSLPWLEPIVSLAGIVRQPQAVAGLIRIGGFGGEAGLVKYLQTEKIDLSIDATHPFAAQISRNAAAAATQVGIPWLMLIRPEWERSIGDDWIDVASLEAAVMAIPATAKRIFLTIGKQQLSSFASLTDRWCLMRSIDPPDASILLPPGQLLLDRGPFDLDRERQLLIDYRIDAIVSKNSGGAATYAKIIAARELGLPVIMVQRPIVPKGESVVDVAGAMKWLSVSGLVV